MVKPAPVIATEFTVTGVVPADAKINVCIVGVLTATLPKPRLVVLTANCGFVAVPVPPRAITVVPPVVELLLIETCPLTVPVADGANSICKVKDWFGFRVAGKLWARKVKPVPVTAAELTVTAEVPVDVNVNVNVVVVFTITLPKLRLFELNVNCGLGADVPVAIKATTAGVPVDELLLTVSCPLTLPIAVGANRICNVIDWVGLNVAGKLPPISVKPVPVSVAELTVTGEVPVDVNVNDCVVAEFTVTLPKLRVAALTVNCGLGAVVQVPLKTTTAVEAVDESLLIVS
jgi:hypothetical protein